MYEYKISNNESYLQDAFKAWENGYIKGCKYCKIALCESYEYPYQERLKYAVSFNINDRETLEIILEVAAIFLESDKIIEYLKFALNDKILSNNVVGYYFYSVILSKLIRKIYCPELKEIYSYLENYKIFDLFEELIIFHRFCGFKIHLYNHSNLVNIRKSINKHSMQHCTENILKNPQFYWLEDNDPISAYMIRTNIQDCELSTQECTICYENTYNIPRKSCYHSFCLECSIKLEFKPCPLCRTIDNTPMRRT